MDTWTERLELPDGQYAVLLTRLPAERVLIVRRAIGTTDPDFVDAVIRAHLWEARLKHALTGAEIGADDVGMAEPPIVDAIGEAALRLHVAWRREAYPKATAETEAENSASPSSADTQPE